MHRLAVSEIFGPTFQGEGPSSGKRAVFLRLAGCNLKCGINGGWHCDTPYTWDWRGEIGPAYSTAEQVRLMEPAEVSAALDALDPEHRTILVITGGEPLLQARAIGSLRMWRESEIETNGTIAPPWKNPTVSYNISPKLESSGNPLEARFKVDVLGEFADLGLQSRFKFVCTNEGDLDEVAEVCRLAGIQNEQVWLMPEGVTQLALLQRGAWLADAALAAGYNYTQRLHVLTWGNERGK